MDETGIRLTFDDGPDPVWTPRMLDALDDAEAEATFFVITPLAQCYPGLIHETLERGHRVEFHCTLHLRHTERTRPAVERDTEAGLEILRGLGVEPKMWRPPWGVLEAWSEEVAAQFGLRIVLWDVDTNDWRGDEAPRMLESIAPWLKPGSVLLMHDGVGPGARRSGCPNTVALIRPLVERIRSLGCEPAHSELPVEQANLYP